MEFIAVVIGLLFLAAPVLAIIALVKLSRLKDEISDLRRELNLYIAKSGAAPKRASTPEAVEMARRRAQALRAQTPVQQTDVQPASTTEPKLETQSGPQAQAAPPEKAAQLQKRPQKTSPQKTSKHKPAPAKAAKAAKPDKPSLEERIGSQWSVWVGGIALAIGAVFLIRFSIESGVFTPALRLMLAAVLGLAAIGGGEWLRRHDGLLKPGAGGKNIPAFQQAYIPGVLTGIGIFTGLGVIYAAHNLYGFIGPTPAFILLGIMSLAGLGLGLLHGPKLAALGLIAGLAAPFLVQSTTPNLATLLGYIVIVSSCALWLAQKRGWHGLSVLTLFGLLIWVFITQFMIKALPSAVMWGLFTALTYGASLWTSLRYEGLEKTANKTDPALKTGGFDRRLSALWTMGLGLILLIAYHFNAPKDIMLGVGLCFASLFILAGAVKTRFNVHILIGGAIASLYAFRSHIDVNSAMALAGVTAIIVWGLGLRESLKGKTSTPPRGLTSVQWSGVSAFAPIFIWAALSQLRGEGVSIRSSFFDLNALGLSEAVVYGVFAALMGLTAEFLWRRADKPPAKNIPLNIYVVAATLSVLSAILYVLNLDAQFYAVLLGAGAAIGLYHLRPAWTLRPILGGAILLSLYLAIFHHIQGGDVGRRYIANSLWIFLALPAALSYLAAKVLDKTEDDIWSEGLKAAALSSSALFMVMQIHHLMNKGYVLASSFSLEEFALLVLMGLCFTLGSAWMERGTTAPLHKRPLHKQLLPVLSMGLSGLTFGIFVIAIVFKLNPLFNAGSEIKGVFILNSLLLAYLLPAGLMGAIALWSRNSRPPLYVRSAAGLGLLSFMLYITASVRHVFSGTVISLFAAAPRGFELYAISAAWLVVGISLLVFGLKTRRRDVRIVSGVIIIITVLKAFLIDMAGLEGVLRAMSFVVLGLILIVIGRVYQKLIFKGEAPDISKTAKPL